MKDLDPTHRAILNHCVDGFTPIRSVAKAVDVSESTLYRKKDDLLEAGLIEARNRDGVPGSEFRTTDRGERALGNGREGGTSTPMISLDALPTDEQKRVAELVIAALTARENEIATAHNPAFYFFGPTGEGKTLTARFLAALITGNPDADARLIDDSWTETGRALFRRKAGDTVVHESPLLSEPLVCFDEAHKIGDAQVRRELRTYLQGRLSVRHEDETIRVRPVPIVTEKRDEREDDDRDAPLHDRLIFETDELRRGIPLDFHAVSKVTLGDEELVQAGAQAGPLEVPTCELLDKDVLDTIETVLAACLTNDTGGDVDPEMLRVIASGLRPFADDVDNALARTLENYLVCVSTVGWTVDDWHTRFRNVMRDSGDMGGQTNVPTTQDSSGNPLIESDQTTGDRTTEQEIFRLVLHERMPPEEIVAQGIASADKVETTLEKLNRLTRYDILPPGSLEERCEEIWEDAYDAGYEEATRTFLVEYPCNNCGKPIQLTDSDAKDAMFETLQQASQPNTDVDWNWGHKRCPTDKPVRTDGGYESDSGPPDNFRDEYFGNALGDESVTVSPEIERQQEELAQLESKKDDAKATLQAIEERKRQAQQDHRKLTEKAESLRTEIVDLEAQHEELQTKREREEEALADLREEVLTESEFDSIQALVAAAREYVENQAEAQKLEAELASLEEQLEEAEIRRDELRDQIETLETIGDLEGEIADRETRIAELTSDIEQKETRCDELEAELRDLRAEQSKALAVLQQGRAAAFTKIKAEVLEELPPDERVESMENLARNVLNDRELMLLERNLLRDLNPEIQREFARELLKQSVEPAMQAFKREIQQFQQT